MNTESRTCQNCKQIFQIELEDFAFYEKIKVPPPTFCSHCRLRRRLAFFNIFNLYQRKCDLCQEIKISYYPPDAPYRVYCPSCWWSDKWDPYAYGREYDFSRNFFEQYNELLHEVPLLGLSIDLPTSESSPYNNHAGHLKDCYLLFHAAEDENSTYGFTSFHNKEVFDCTAVISSTLCHDSLESLKNYNCVGMDHAGDCLDSFFLRDSENCRNCFASANLRHKEYHIFNKPHSRGDYFAEIKKWDLGSYKIYQEIKKLAEEHFKKFPPKPEQISATCVGVSGNYIGDSRNCRECFQANGAEDCKYLFMTESPPVRDCYDITSWGDNLHLSYECLISGEFSSNLKFCYEAGINLHNAEYCKLSTGGADHFGCVSVKKGQYAIFNKSYNESDFQYLREKIIKQMHNLPYHDKNRLIYKYGEFFPPEISTFGYNLTAAQNFFPLDKEAAEKEGWLWRDSAEKEKTHTLGWENLPDHIRDTPDNILEEIVECRDCGKGFKIIPLELDFLRRQNLPLPRSCPFCRIQGKFKIWLERFKILERTCGRCGIKFKTSFTAQEAPDILCRECWLKEIM